jgi:hypothetical protein
VGKHSRTKGRAFEQLVANQYRERWPEATVRRSLQAHRPYEPDVVVEHPAGGSPSRLWTECQHADAPQPLLKLAQAERDILAAEKAGRGEPVPGCLWLPVVVWRKSGSSTVYATCRLGVLMCLTGNVGVATLRPSLVVTVAFADLVAAILTA